MNEALELAGKLYAYTRGDEYQRVTEEAAAILCSQHAEIEGWKKDQKENLRNQCDLHAEIVALEEDRDGLRKAAQMALDAIEELRYSNTTHTAATKAGKAIDALRKELSE